MKVDASVHEFGCRPTKTDRRRFLTSNPTSPVRIPETDPQAEIESLLSVSPEFVADASRNYVRYYVRDLQAALKRIRDG